MNNLTVEGTVLINASPAKIWTVLTDPDKIMQYLGAQTKTNWEVGAGITWEGEHPGGRFQNKGSVLANVAGQHLHHVLERYGGDEDAPHNYSVITYQLEPREYGVTKFSYHREKIPTLMEKQVFEMHLPSMLQEIKRLAEE